MTQVFWYVYKIGGGPPRYKHSTYDLAVTEAQRLAETHNGEYEILEAKAKVTPAPKTVVEEFSPENGQTQLPHTSYCGCLQCIPF